MNKLKHWFASDSNLFVLVVIFLIIFIALGVIGVSNSGIRAYRFGNDLFLSSWRH